MICLFFESAPVSKFDDVMWFYISVPYYYYYKLLPIETIMNE